MLFSVRDDVVFDISVDRLFYSFLQLIDATQSRQ